MFVAGVRERQASMVGEHSRTAPARACSKGWQQGCRCMRQANEIQYVLGPADTECMKTHTMLSSRVQRLLCMPPSTKAAHLNDALLLHRQHARRPPAAHAALPLLAVVPVRRLRRSQRAAAKSQLCAAHRHQRTLGCSRREAALLAVPLLHLPLLLNVYLFILILHQLRSAGRATSSSCCSVALAAAVLPPAAGRDSAGTSTSAS